MGYLYYKSMNITRRVFLNRCLYLAGAPALHSKRAEAVPLPAQRAAARADYPGYLGLEKRGLLAGREEKLSAFYESCRLCPRDCRVDRLKGEKGVCQATAIVKLSSAFPHFGEERPLVGRGGSGTIFFSHCGLRCVYCQNYTISIDGEGVEITAEQLAETMVKVQSFGCHNINLVTPTHYVPGIVRAVRLAAHRGLKIPLVYNTSGYETLETLELLDGIIDIYLPDFKYWHPTAAAKFSSGAYNYPYYAKLALKEMYRQVGNLQVDERGIAVRGVILRHLILPNRIAGTEEVIKFIAKELSPEAYVNLMSQYRPEHKAVEYPEISRRLTRSEYAEALVWAKKSGLTRLDR
jgi:putative pyruvate formate lyase activating enzyme